MLVAVIIYGVDLILVGDISGRGSFLSLIGFFCRLVCLSRLLLFILAESVQHSLRKLDCYHLALTIGMRIRDRLVKLAFLVSTFLAVDLKHLLFKFFQILLSAHFFSLKLEIFFICLVLVAYT